MIDKIKLMLAPYMVFIIIGALAASHALVWYKGDSHGHAKGFKEGISHYTSLKTEVDRANTTLAAEHKRKIEQAESNTYDVALAYARNSARVQRELVSRLERVRRDAANADHRGENPAVAGASRLADGSPPDDRPDSGASPPDRYAEVCQVLEQDCADTTVKLIFLQSWVRRVCK